MHNWLMWMFSSEHTEPEMITEYKIIYEIFLGDFN